MEQKNGIKTISFTDIPAKSLDVQSFLYYGKAIKVKEKNTIFNITKENIVIEIIF